MAQTDSKREDAIKAGHVWSDFNGCEEHVCVLHLGHSGPCRCSCWHDSRGYYVKPSGFVLWGHNPSYGPNAIKITGGTVAHCRREKSYRESHGGWSDLVIRKAAP